MAGASTGDDEIFGGGVAGEVLRATDWSQNPLGPLRDWPLSLKTMVRAMLSTRQATCLFWGAELVNLYNDGFIPMLGEKHPAAMGQPARELWSDAWPVVGGLLSGVVERGEAVLFQEMLIPIVRGGALQDAWWNYSYSPAFDDAGRVAGVLVVATETTNEVSGRKALEAATRDAELARKEVQAVFMQAPLPIAFLKGPEHRFVLVNEPYTRLVGRDVLGKTLSEAFSDEEVGHYRPLLDRVVASGEAVSLKEAPLRLRNAAGPVDDRFIDVTYRAVYDGDGSVMGTLAVIHDVTLQVQARLRDSELRKRAEAASLAKDEFLALVSHELRTPLNAILGWAKLLDGPREPERVEKGLTVIRRNATAQAKLIDDILDVSRIISGKVVIDSRRVELARVIENAVESIRPAATSKRIELVLDIADPETALVADETRLQQVVWNLLSNAVKFTPAGGVVSVSSATTDSSVSIRIADTGNGIESSFLPHVFDRFRQADASTTKRYGGLGLGLAIVRHLVELHGGTVTAHSEGEGKGATFEVVLPIRATRPAERSLAAADDEAATVSRQVREGRPLVGVRVLVVDDVEDTRELVATSLQEAGALVSQAASAREAMTVLESATVDVAVSDIGMPFEDGYRLVEKIRASAIPSISELPVVALTAYARDQDKKRALTAGFQEHLAKPVDSDLLVGTIATLVHSRR